MKTTRFVLHTIVALTFLLVACTSNNPSPRPDLISNTATSTTANPTRTGAIQKMVNWIGHWQDEDLRETLVREIATEYEFNHPGTKVNLKFTKDALGLRSKVVMAKAIADMVRMQDYKWDIVWLDDDIYQMVATELGDADWGKKHLVDFQQVKGFPQSEKPFIVNDPSYRNRTGGILVGPYVEGYYYALYYNTIVAKKMGLEIKSQGMSFDDLLSYVRRVSEYNKANSTEIAAFYEAKDWTTIEILFQNLAKSEFKDYASAKSEDSSEEKRQALLKTLSAFEQLAQYKPLMPSYVENDWFLTRGLVLDDQALFYVNGTWMYSHWRGLDQSKLTKMIPVELPVFQPAPFYLGGYIPTWAVFKDAPNREASIDLLMYWAQPDVAERWVRYTKNPTGLLGNVASSTVGADPFETFQSAMTQKYGPSLDYSPNWAYLVGTQNVLLKPDCDQALLGVLTGKLTAKQAYDQLMAKMVPNTPSTK